MRVCKVRATSWMPKRRRRRGNCVDGAGLKLTLLIKRAEKSNELVRISSSFDTAASFMFRPVP